MVVVGVDIRGGLMVYGGLIVTGGDIVVGVAGGLTLVVEEEEGK